MTRILVDTCAYIAALRGHGPIREALSVAETIVVSPVMLGELRTGFTKGTAGRRNESLLQRFLDSPRVSIVEIDEETSQAYAVIHDGLRRAGRPVPTNDLWLAASAMQHGLRVLTTDERFDGIAQIIVELHDAKG
jgi:tRNA(fMet)-specific endonuclease VapC